MCNGFAFGTLESRFVEVEVEVEVEVVEVEVVEVEVELSECEFKDEVVFGRFEAASIGELFVEVEVVVGPGKRITLGIDLGL